MELVKVGEHTYYLPNRCNIGVYRLDDDSIYLIDTGNDSDCGKKILKVVEEQGWTVRGIINTHSNADHIGGNHLIQKRTNCPIYTSKIEKSFTENPMLEPSFLYGGFPLSEMKNKMLLAQESDVLDLPEIEGLEFIPLKGHFFDMIGIRTKDDVYFLADSLFSEETIEKYHFFFIYDVKGYLETLSFLSTLEKGIYIPSHVEKTTDIKELIEKNRKKIEEIIECILSFCEEETTWEELLKHIFDVYSLDMNVNQYYLVGSTLKSYLSYLKEEGLIDYQFKENRMVWKRCSLK